MVEEILKRVEANDAVRMGMLGSYYCHGYLGLQQDHNKAIELWTRAADLGSKKAHISLYDVYEYSDLGDLNFYSSIIQTKLLSIGSLLHLLGHILPCITC